MTKFTDRFLRLPIKIYNTRQAELTGKEHLEDTLAKVNPIEIAAYYRDFDDDKECINLVLKSGWKTNVYLSVKEFESLLDQHYESKT